MILVWLKRDVRLLDHEPLSLAASRAEPLVILYVYEPCHLTSDTYHEAQHRFINEGLADLNEQLRTISACDGEGGITFRTGGIIDVLRELHEQSPITTIYSHREVGNHVSRMRNEQVAAWVEAHGLEWIQCQQDGVSDVRHEELDEGSWAKKWTAAMSGPQHQIPAQLHFVGSSTIQRGGLMDAQACGVSHLGVRPGAQRGGEARALATLESFLQRRGERYSDELSSPLTGWDSCSRLSTYLAWGHVSLRHVFQALSERQEALRRSKKEGAETGGWLKSLAAHGSRLRWRSHFSQKLHDQPSVEFENMVRTYDALRTEFDRAKFDAWVEGRTGYPMRAASTLELASDLASAAVQCGQPCTPTLHTNPAHERG
jgi:deoxyribodipyrimidine photo-lyase